MLTTSEISPHLSHRPGIYHTNSTNDELMPEKLHRYYYILLSTRRPGWLSRPELAVRLVDYLADSDQFRIDYCQDGVYLFVKEFSPA